MKIIGNMTEIEQSIWNMTFSAAFTQEFINDYKDGYNQFCDVLRQMTAYRAVAVANKAIESLREKEQLGY